MSQAFSETLKLGKKGIVVIPAILRQRLGLKEGSLVIIEEVANGLVLKPALAVPVEIYSPERKAEFLLSNAVSKKDYNKACTEVRKMGLDPAKIQHAKP